MHREIYHFSPGAPESIGVHGLFEGSKPLICFVLVAHRNGDISSDMVLHSLQEDWHVEFMKYHSSGCTGGK